MTEINVVGIGTALILIGFLIVVIGSLFGKDANVKVGVGGFIGPVPFGWANDPKMLPWIIALTAIAAIIFVLLALRGSMF